MKKPLTRVLITGGSGDIASALVPLLSDCQIILMTRDKAQLERLYQSNDLVQVLACDLRDPDAIARISEAILSQYGGVDVLINNAGFGPFKPFIETTDEEMRELFEINSFAVMRLVRYFLPNMIADQKGHIINVVSLAGKVATSKASLYAASKAAVLAFSNSLRLEVWDDNIKMTTVNTGPVKSKFHAKQPAYLEKVKGFALAPEEVALAIKQVIAKPKREVNLPRRLALATYCYQLMPGFSDWLTRKVFNYK